ncbi:tyrosine-type recombinase/integrase [Mycolicibacterium sphagni]|uniref:Site-specific integrase n=1 Tax=Mycolicibacterium sphagni TaxID=1786 RepID=A0A255DRI6_9MYCO|nr:tyrosine-type recombinase/integrase [Mycolicibacterium sphagni]OYN81700.1 site-specific integrase [Mycolicibacterium sphagni]
MPETDAKSKRRPKGDGALFYDEKRGLHIGIVSVYGPDGKRHQKRVSSKLESKALEKLNKLRADVVNGTVTVTPTEIRTVGGWLDYWLIHIVKPSVKPRTYDSYAATVRLYLKPEIGKIRLDKLQPARVRELYTKLRLRGTADTKPSTRNAQKAHQVLNAALTRAVKDGHLSRNVCKAVDNPKHKKAPRGAFELKTAVHVLKTAAALDDKNIPGKPKLASRWVAAFMTGARQAELLGMELDRIDLDQGVMEISWQLQRMHYTHGCGTKANGEPRCGRQRVGYCPDRKWGFDPVFDYRDCHRSLVWTRPKSLAGERWVPMAPLLHESLKVHLRMDTDPNPHGLVWHHRDGRPISQEDDNEQWNILIAAAGIEKKSREVVLHEARNTAATMLLESGVDVKVIQSILGHASILQTRDYQRVNLELSKVAVSTAFDALLPDV